LSRRSPIKLASCKYMFHCRLKARPWFVFVSESITLNLRPLRDSTVIQTWSSGLMPSSQREAMACS